MTEPDPLGAILYLVIYLGLQSFLDSPKTPADQNIVRGSALILAVHSHIAIRRTISENTSFRPDETTTFNCLLMYRSLALSCAKKRIIFFKDPMAWHGAKTRGYWSADFVLLTAESNGLTLREWKFTGRSVQRRFVNS